MRKGKLQCTIEEEGVDLSPRNEKNEKKQMKNPKITLVEVVKRVMPIIQVTQSMALDKIEWQKRIHVIN